jgi:hypothetical protein
MIEGLKETISATEEAKNNALREYESIKVIAKKCEVIFFSFGIAY